MVASLAGTWSDFDHAAMAIGLAVVFDSLDGRVARMTGTNTEFGVQFDSLADVVSFGMAPAVMAYAWGVRSLPADGRRAGQLVGDLAWGSCLLFLICCAWRLARFNVQGMAPGGSKYFVGMPTPAAAGVVAAMVHGFKEPLHDWQWSVVVVAAGGRIRRADDEHDSIQQLQGFSVDTEAAVADDRLVVLDFGGGLEIFGVCPGDLVTRYAAVRVALHLVRMLRHRAGLADRVIHAFA